MCSSNHLANCVTHWWTSSHRLALCAMWHLHSLHCLSRLDQCFCIFPVGVGCEVLEHRHYCNWWVTSSWEEEEGGREAYEGILYWSKFKLCSLYMVKKEIIFLTTVWWWLVVFLSCFIVQYTCIHLVSHSYVLPTGGLFQRYPDFWDIYEEYGQNYSLACRWLHVHLLHCVCICISVL